MCSRFSEKSFEIRFCAALSAALMPFNRNPKWFGMTQKQERYSGIDSMIQLGGGKLYLFQFKAKRNPRETFTLGKNQWRCLSRVEGKFKNSTFYVLPDIYSVEQSSTIQCILRHSWLCPVNSIGKTFKQNANSVTLTLDVNSSHSNLNNIHISDPVDVLSCCEKFGCFCPPKFKGCIFSDGKMLVIQYIHGNVFVESTLNHPMLTPKFENSGIWIDGKDGDKEYDELSIRERNSIRHPLDFDEYFGNDNFPRLYGFFLPIP